MTKALASPSPHLSATLDGAVATVTIDKPERRNAFDTAMWQALPELVRAIEAEDDARVIILRGASGQAFSAGADITEFAEKRATAEAARAYDAVTEQGYDAVRSSQLPSIAAIHGFCFGGGLGLALSCDMRIAADDARFAIPAARLGLAYPFDSLRHLVAVAGPAAAKELIFTGRRFSAQETREMGLVGKVCPAETVYDEAMQLAATIAGNAPLTIRCAKAVIDDAAAWPGAARRDDIEDLATACYASDDYAEGRAAFLEKRKPVFTGR